MKRLNLDVGGQNVTLMYSKKPMSNNDMVVEYVQKDDNRTHFYVRANPQGIPEAAARWVHEERLRQYETFDKNTTIYIHMEK